MPGIPLYLWDTPWRFILITYTDPLSLMMLAWKDLRVYRSFNCCYFGSLSVWYFYIFPAFYCFPSWKTSIGGNVVVFFFTGSFVQGLPFCMSIPNPTNSLIFLLLNTRLLLLLQASKSPKVEHPVDCVVTLFVQNPIHNPVVSRTTACSDSHSR